MADHITKPLWKTTTADSSSTTSPRRHAGTQNTHDPLGHDKALPISVTESATEHPAGAHQQPRDQTEVRQTFRRCGAGRPGEPGSRRGLTDTPGRIAAVEQSLSYQWRLRTKLCH